MNVVDRIFPSFIQRVDSAVPLGYTTPPFPSLYWPLPAGATQSFYLYRPDDIFRFTVYWTLLLVGGIHFIAALGVDLLIFDPVAGVLVDLAEANLLALAGRGKKRDRAGDERQLQIAFPIGRLLLRH